MQKYIIIMALKPSINLEKVSKEVSEKNQLDVVVFETEKYSRFTHSFRIPFKELDFVIPSMSMFNVIDTFSDVIIKALEERMESCVDMLSRNMFNIVESNADRIMFKKESGYYHSFNHHSFRWMQEAAHLIYERKFEDLRRKHYDQIMKALYWVEKPAQRDGISFGDLTSVCLKGSKISAI